MYILIIEEGCGEREQEVHSFQSVKSARSFIWAYIRRVDKAGRENYDTVDAKLYRNSSRSKCVLVDEFSDVALKDGYAEGWKSEGRRAEETREFYKRSSVQRDDPQTLNDKFSFCKIPIGKLKENDL